MKIENVIYVLTNPQYPGYIKIGYASDLKQRLSSLNTGALVEFEPYAVYETTQKNADINIHKIIKLLNPILQASKFNEKNQAKQKEFFKIEPEEAFALLEQIAIVSGTRHKLYRLDKYLNKFDVKPKNPVANDDDNDKDGDTKNTPPTTPPSTTLVPIQPLHPLPAKNNCIPDGIYTMKTKIKKLNKVVQGTMEVKNGEFVLKAGSDVAPEDARYHRNKHFFDNLKENDGVLLEDAVFTSVSTAASIVRGGATNGWDYWQNNKGEYISIYRN